MYTLIIFYALNYRKIIFWNNTCNPYCKIAIMKKKLFALAGGLAGACTLSLIHQALRFSVPDIAPRMDLMGIEAMRKTRQKIGMYIPPENELYRQTFIGDIAANTLYYSLVGRGSQFKGLLLGTAAGLGAVELPVKIGLNPANSNRTKATQYLTLGLYVVGGLTAAATAKWLHSLTD